MEIMLIVVLFASLVIASIVDIKTREVPDWLSYALIAAASGIRIIESIMTTSWQPFIEGLLGFSACFITGYLLYRTAQWGGGDTKLLMGVGAAIGFPWTVEKVPTLFLFFVNMIITGAVIGIIVLIFHGIKERKKVVQELKQQRHQHKRFEKNVLMGFLVLLILCIILFFYAPIKIMVATLPVLAIPIAYYLILLVRSVEKTAFIKTIAPDQLTEGDWLAEPVKMDNKIITATAYSGVTKQDIKKLTNLYAQGKIKKVVMKTGIPFVPSFLAGYVCTILIGNWFALVL